MPKFNIVSAIGKIYEAYRGKSSVDKVILLTDATCLIAREIAEIQDTLSDSDWNKLIEWEENQ